MIQIKNVTLPNILAYTEPSTIQPEQIVRWYDISIFISYLEISSMYVCHYTTYKEKVKSRHFKAHPLTYSNPINNRKMIMIDQTMPIWMFFQQKVYF